MLTTAYSTGLFGIDGYIVTVECSFSENLPYFEIVGLPDNAVRESKRRLAAASENSARTLPEAEIIINLAPADRRKEGSSLDLAMIAAIWKACGILPPDTDLSDSVLIGELSFFGELRPIRGVLSRTLCARDAGFKKVFVPARNAAEAAAVGGVSVYPVDNLDSFFRHLTGGKTIAAAEFTEPDFSAPPSDGADFSEIKGQERARRAMEIAAAGGHNILMVGPPGTGKSMLAKRLPTIMPRMSFEESVEVTKIHSASGTLDSESGLVTVRPFRSPHHTMSAPALVGGGAIPMPGEISLASGGVLFLDELPEFSRESLEVLRQPLEDGCITVSRAAGSATYPSRFQLVAAMNPCKCGYYGHPTRTCTCSPSAVRQYRSRVSGPLLDRIDLCVEMDPVAFDELHGAAPSESSAELRKQVLAARAIQAQRYAAPGYEDVRCNAQLTAGQVRRICRMTPAAEQLLRASYETLGLSARAHDRILRVARTIADLSGKRLLDEDSLLEALQYRAQEKVDLTF